MDIRHGLPDLCTSYHDAIRTELENTIDSSPPVLSSMLRYHMGWEDKNGCVCEGPQASSLDRLSVFSVAGQWMVIHRR